jgi:hypothetical protein
MAGVADLQLRPAVARLPGQVRCDGQRHRGAGQHLCCAAAAQFAGEQHLQPALVEAAGAAVQTDGRLKARYPPAGPAVRRLPEQDREELTGKPSSPCT